jgi:hypothetical protein
MVDLPGVGRRLVTTQAPQGPSPGAVAAPYRILADMMDFAGDKLETAGLPNMEKAGSQSVVRDADGKLQVELRPEWTKSDQAWNAGVKTAALAEYSAGINGPKGLMGLRQQFDGDAQGFRAAADVYIERLAAEAPGDLSPAVRASAQKAAVQFENGILAGSFRLDRRRASRRVYAAREKLEADMDTIARQGGIGTPEYAALSADYEALGEMGAKNPIIDMTPQQVKADSARVAARHRASAIVGTAERAVAAGDDAGAHDVIRAVADGDLPLTEPARRELVPKLKAAVARRSRAEADAVRAADAADDLARMETQSIAEERAMNGTLTTDWIRQEADNLGPVVRRRLLAAADAVERGEPDAATYGALLRQAASGNPEVRSAALDAHAEGKIGKSALTRIEESLNAFSDDPRPWVRELRDGTVARLAPSEMQAPAAGRRQLEAAFALDDWLKRNPEASPSEASDFADGLANRYRAAAVRSEKESLPMPRFAGGSRDAMNPESLVSAARQLKEARIAGALTDDQFREEVANMRRWQDLLQRESKGIR